jgi:hypothetical protein
MERFGAKAPNSNVQAPVKLQAVITHGAFAPSLEKNQFRMDELSAARIGAWKLVLLWSLDVGRLVLAR